MLHAETTPRISRIYAQIDGDCWRACLASLLGCELREVPQPDCTKGHVCQFERLLAPRNLKLVRKSIDPVVWVEAGAPTGSGIFVIASVDDGSHAVVAQINTNGNHRVVHDPDPHARRRTVLVDGIDALLPVNADTKHFGGRDWSCVACVALDIDPDGEPFDAHVRAWRQ